MKHFQSAYLRPFPGLNLLTSLHLVNIQPNSKWHPHPHQNFLHSPLLTRVQNDATRVVNQRKMKKGTKGNEPKTAVFYTEVLSILHIELHQIGRRQGWGVFHPPTTPLEAVIQVHYCKKFVHVDYNIYRNATKLSAFQNAQIGIILLEFTKHKQDFTL